jgi:DNA-binding transcriptional regulator YhcF (GntR family)
MNYEFTEGVRRALSGARDAAAGLRHDYVGTEHILAGVVRVDEAQSLLGRLGLTRQEVERIISTTVRAGKAIPPRLGAKLPYTSRAKKVLEFAMASARELNDNHISTDHLVLGLLREEKGIAAQILSELGVTAESVRRALQGDVPATRFHVRVDDSADVSIYEQIVAQVQEGVATGVLRPGERLPTVRQLADELDIAPGTVARAYGELERRGVVITEGARGTRVADRERSAEPERPETLAGLLRPVAVAAYHMGATAQELRTALERAMTGIFAKPD